VASERERTIAEVLALFALATGAAAAFYQAGAHGVGVIERNLHALVALVFIVLPQVALRRRGNIERYGFTTEPLGLGLAIAATAIVVVLPLFGLGFWALVRAACAHAPALVPGSCFRAAHPVWRLPPGFALQAVAQLIVVALPEELFFRGYVQGRLEEALPPRFSLWGAPVGGAWILASALFALGHYFVTFEPQMLTRFFPGLAFGWMYARTRSILPSTIFHAACNLIMAWLGASLLW